jgi:hypothetical protein
MRRMGEFRNLKVETNNGKNGERAIWTVSFDATGTVRKGDLFTIKIPKTIRTPIEPICDKVKCLVYEII